MRHNRPFRCIVISTMLTFVAGSSFAHPKMTLALFRKFWPSAETSVVKRVKLDAGEKAEIGNALGGYPETLNDVDVFIASSNTSTLGVLANLNVGATDIGVAMDRSRKKIVKVYFYTTGADMRALNNSGFLKQFVGKTSADTFKLGKDIKAPTATDKQAQSLASIVKGTTLFLQKGW